MEASWVLWRDFSKDWNCFSIISDPQSVLYLNVTWFWDWVSRWPGFLCYKWVRDRTSRQMNSLPTSPDPGFTGTSRRSRGEMLWCRDPQGSTAFRPRVSLWLQPCSEQTCCAPRGLERLAWDPPEQERPTWLVVWWPQMERSRGGPSSYPQGEALPVIGENAAVDDEKCLSLRKCQILTITWMFETTDLFFERILLQFWAFYYAYISTDHSLVWI